jgi:hypothetical protein
VLKAGRGGEGETNDCRRIPVITDLVPVISIKKDAVLHTIGMAGTRPAMT